MIYFPIFSAEMETKRVGGKVITIRPYYGGSKPTPYRNA